MSKWKLADLPRLESGDIFFSRSDSFPGPSIRWFFRDRQGRRAPYNHAGIIAEPEYNGSGLLAVPIIESIWKGPAPGELWQGYHDKDIAIMRPQCSEYLKQRALVLAYAYGARPYDYTIAATIIRKKGLLWFLRALNDLCRDRHVDIPHYRDTPVVCLEEVQEPYATATFPLYPDDLLMPPIPGEIDTCDLVFSTR